MIVNGVLYGEDQQVAEFVRNLVGLKGRWETCSALGVVKDGELLGGVVFHDYRPAADDMELSAAFTSPKWCSARTLTQMLRYPMLQLRLKRATARTAESNWIARDFLERLGFEQEGCLRRAYDGQQDMILYGCLRDQFFWRKV